MSVVDELKKPDVAGSFKRLAVMCVSGSAGVTAVLVLADVIRQQPQIVVEVLKSWGPGFGLPAVLGALLIWRIDKRAGEFVGALKDLATSHSGLQGSVEALAEKDDREAQATKAAIGFVAQQNEEILKLIHERLPKP